MNRPKVRLECPVFWKEKERRGMLVAENASKCMIMTSNEQDKQAFQTVDQQISPKQTNKSSFEMRTEM